MLIRWVLHTIQRLIIWSLRSIVKSSHLTMLPTICFKEWLLTDDACVFVVYYMYIWNMIHVNNIRVIFTHTCFFCVFVVYLYCVCRCDCCLDFISCIHKYICIHIAACILKHLCWSDHTYICMCIDIMESDTQVHPYQKYSLCKHTNSHTKNTQTTIL